MRRAALAAVLLSGLAGCGGSDDAREEPRPAPPTGLGFAPDLRTADARSPFVPAGEAAWRCETGGRLWLAMSEQGEVAASIGGRTLASVSSARGLINRACDRAARPRARGRPAQSRLGAIALRCSVPDVVVIDFGGGDVIVRAPAGRFLVGAAVRPDRVGVGTYWSGGCAAEARFLPTG